MKTILRVASSVLLCLLLCQGNEVHRAGAAPLPPTVEDGVEGDWQGTLTVPGGRLRVVFHIVRDDEGALTATLDSPDQGAAGIPVDEVVVTDNRLRMEVPSIFGVYEGTISEDGTRIDGTWTQGGAALPLVLERTDEAPEVRRPQTPEQPYPYREEEVVFEHAEAGITLAGTLTLPPSDGPHPAVALLSGSGPQDRDEALLGHRPFLILADYLTRRGIAVLRFDDRGVGASTGDFAAATSEDFAGDALAAVAYLKSRSEIDPAKIGLAGHSEGGLVAPMAAARSSDVAFLVLMAGPGLTGEEILYAQGVLINRANGAPEEAVAQNRRTQERLFSVLKQEPDSVAAVAQLRAIMKEAMAGLSDADKEALGLSGLDEETLIQRQIGALLTPWMRYFLTYDPLPALRNAACPVLAVNGEKDLQVPPQENLDAIEAALREGGNPDYTVLLLPGLNHLFQTSATGAPSEYGQIEETFSPTALQAIGDWIVARTLRE